MAYPVLAKTWEFRTNVITGWRATSAYTFGQELYIDIKNVLTDTVGHYFIDGDFVSDGGVGTRLQNLTQTAVDSGWVGKTIKIRGQGNSNDGDFTITATTASSIDYDNASPVVEAAAGSANIIGGNFTVPWILDHTVKQPTTAWIGASGDGVDALRVPADWRGDTANWSQFVVRNPVTGTYWCIYGDTSTTSQRQYMVPRGTTAPNTLEASGSTSVAPTGTTVTNPSGSISAHKNFESNGNAPFGTSYAPVKLHLAMSNDGEQTRLLATGFGGCTLFWLDAVVLHPHATWATAPETPVVTGMSDSGSSTGYGATYATFNDTPFCIGSRVPSGYAAVSDFYIPGIYLTSEGYGSATAGENLTVPNELSQEWPFYPVGLYSLELTIRARLGMIPDLWWTSTGLVGGETFPDDLTRQFLCIGDMIMPWDGSLPEFS